MARKGKAARKNTYFRQTAKAFRAARQTQVFSYLKRSVPYSVYIHSRRFAARNYSRLNKLVTKNAKVSRILRKSKLSNTKKASNR